MQQNTSFASGRFAFSIDGEFAGFIRKVSGGNIKGEVVENSLGVSSFPKKHLATISHEPLTMEVSAGAGKSMWEWIKSSFDKGFVPKTTELDTFDSNYRVMATRVFQDAYISKVEFPALDASSKDAYGVIVEITPKMIRYEKGSGGQIKSDEEVRRRFICSNFRLDIDGLDCKRISKIEGFTWSQSIANDEVGSFRDPVNSAATIKVPNLKITFSAADLESWFGWFQSFVIDGKCTDSDEKSGTITFLGPDMQEELLTIELQHVGIFSLSESTSEGGQSVARFDAELYVEEMQLSK